jgi:hypothetical protein
MQMTPTEGHLDPTPSRTPNVQMEPTSYRSPIPIPSRTRTPSPTPHPPQPSPTPAANIDVLLSICPSEAELERFKSDFDILFDPDLGFPTYACQNGTGPGDTINPRLTFFQALRAIHALQFDQSLPWTEYSLYDWLKNTINGMVLTETEFSHCCEAENRIVLKADLLEQADNLVWANPQSGGGLIGFIGLIVHEARHAEVGGHTCGTDDETLEELGAWGVQYYLFIYIAEHSPQGFFTEEQIQAAQSHADTAIGRICHP